ncbi:MAG TPA: nitroreductase family protein [Spirochaetota bacterium]|nr:nitroreductase family protein [Spirochaetota bacterium]
MGPIVDKDKCTLCCECVNICPKEVLSLHNNEIIVNKEDCILCSHCYCVCRFDAITFAELTRPAFSFGYTRTVKHEIKPADIISFIHSRRSIMAFKPDSFSQNQIKDLIQAAVLAPSASNCQRWQFVVLNGREKVLKLAEDIKHFFININKIASNPLIRYLSIFFAGKKILHYYKNNYESVKLALNRAKEGKDLLFHGAPCVIIVHSDMEGSMPIEDGQYAAYNMALTAHAMGLGSCFIGYASATINNANYIKHKLLIPNNHRVHAVIALGYPNTNFVKNALRKKDVNIKFL